MNKMINEFKDESLQDEDKEFEKYCKLYEEKFGKNAYIAEPSGTKKQTIDAIKICLEKNEDILDKLFYVYYIFGHSVPPLIKDGYCLSFISFL